MKDNITRDDFNMIQLQTGTIIQVNDFPQARKPAYQIHVDFGETSWIKKTSAQITDLYTKEELIWKQIIAVTNFPPKQIGSFMSEFLLTWFIQEDNSVVLAIPDKPITNGLHLA